VQILNENNNDALLKSLDIAEKSISSVTKTNNRLIIALITISVTFCIMICVISGFYFIGQGYPEQTQTVTKDEIKQELTKGE